MMSENPNPWAWPEAQEFFKNFDLEVTDPKNRELYGPLLIAVGRDSGQDVVVVEPVPGYVLKTSADGCKKVYVNICSDKVVGRPEYTPPIDDVVAEWNIFIPRVLLPRVNFCDEKVATYNVVFHPETLEKCSDSRIKQFVNETALALIETSFNLTLDKVNFRVSKDQFKGRVQIDTVLREDLSLGSVHELQERPDCGNLILQICCIETTEY